MALQIIPPNRNRQRIGEAIGSGLAMLAQNKINQLSSASRNEQNAQKNTELAELLGLTNTLSAAAPNEVDVESESEELIESGPSQDFLGSVDTKELFEIAKRKNAKKESLRKEKLMEQKESNKETLPFANEIESKFKAAEESDFRLNRMEELLDKGGIGIFDKAIARMGETLKIPFLGEVFDLSGFMSGDAQEFQKLSKDYIKGAKAVFGARITDADLKAYLKTIPTLMQSEEGARRVIKNLRYFNDVDKMKKIATDAIIKKNNGIRPRNISSLVSQKIKKPKELLNQQMKLGVKEAQNIALIKDVDKVLGAAKSLKKENRIDESSLKALKKASQKSRRLLKIIKKAEDKISKKRNELLKI